MGVLMDSLKAIKAMEKSDTEILTADILHKLWMMSPAQLNIIYKGGQRKVKIDDDPDAYHKLWMMSPDQLKAIFGDDVPN